MSKISTKEIFVICFMLGVFLFPGFGNNYIFSLAKTSSVTSSILGFVLGFIPIFMLLFIIKNLNGESIFLFNKNNFKFIGTLLNFVLVLLALAIVFLSSWTILNFVTSQFLTRTSYYFVAIVLFSIIGLGVFYGLEVISRSSIVLFTIFVFISLVSWIFLVPNVEVDNIYPLFDISKLSFFKAAILYALLLTTPLLFISAIKKDDIVDSKNINKRIILSYIFGSIIVITFTFLIMSIFGYDITRILTYPEYSLFKKIKAFDFIERVENIVSVLIFIVFFGGFSYLMYFIKEWFSFSFKIKNKKTSNVFSYVMCLLIPILSIIVFKKFFAYDIYMFIPYILLAINVIFLFIFISMVIKNIFKKVKS